MRLPHPNKSFGSMMLAAGLCAATLMLVFLAYRAIHDSKESARLLLERRAAEQAALLSAGLAQDMKGAHATVLVPITPGEIVLDPPYDLADAFARGFARFPYPESFFVWRDTGDVEGLTYAFNRADRPPAWQAPERLVGPYPVVVLPDPVALRTVVTKARQQARYNRPFEVFETIIDGTPYQVVVGLLYKYDGRGKLFALAGFTVNLAWVRTAYFQELSSQIARIGGASDEVSLAILDESARVVTSTGRNELTGPTRERPFPLLFVDRSLLGSLPDPNLQVSSWTLRATMDSRLATAAAATNISFVLIALAAIATVVGLVVTLRGVRAAAELAAMKSDFVSSVTHELKTPLALIRLVADTLAQGRYHSTNTIREYAGLLSKESRNLTRLIDNLLTYARLSDSRHTYTFEPTHVGDLVVDALEHFQMLLMEQGFAVDVDIPPDLPPVRADRIALIPALETLIDNAVKYSGTSRVLEIRAQGMNGSVAISVLDRGVGIGPDEIERVCDTFFRGRNVKAGGSGLGLAIAKQVVQIHEGRLNIESVIGEGTRVDLILPSATEP